MVDVLRAASCDVAAFDVEPRRSDVRGVDTLALGFFGKIAAVHGTGIALVTNPPFSLAAEYWRRGQMFRRTALLVRITWLERTKDREDVADPVRVIVLPRPKFTGKGSDSATCAWCCWGDWKPGVVRLSHGDRARLQQPAWLD